MIEQVVYFTRDLLKELRLDREHDEIVPASIRCPINGVYLRDLHTRVVPFELDALALDSGEMLIAIDHRHGHIFANECELRCNQPANGARAEDADSHLFSPLVYSRGGL